LPRGGEVPVSIDVVDEGKYVFALEGRAPRESRPIVARKQEDDITLPAFLAVVGRGASGASPKPGGAALSDKGPPLDGASICGALPASCSRLRYEHEVTL
jgi:hypothetical protein